jgi:hypothetical protein
MPSVEYPIHVKNKFLDCFLSELERGSNCPYSSLIIYSMGGSSSGTPLVVMNLPSPAFSLSEDGKAIANSIPSSIVKNSGRAASFDLVNKDMQVVLRGSVGNLDSDAALRIDNPELKKDNVFLISGLVLYLDNCYA